MIFSTPELFSEAKKYLSQHQEELLNDTETVLKRLQIQDGISDYSFLVSSIAKSYEGFLKDFFLKIGIISESEYDSERFRVGKTLNPSLRYKRFSVFQKLANYHEKGEELAEILWDAWKFGRNEIFHYFPSNYKSLTKEEAEERIDLLLKAIIQAGEFLNQDKNN
jgi:hypothetical protein